MPGALPPQAAVKPTTSDASAVNSTPYNPEEPSIESSAAKTIKSSLSRVSICRDGVAGSSGTSFFFKSCNWEKGVSILILHWNFAGKHLLGAVHVVFLIAG